MKISGIIEQKNLVLINVSSKIDHLGLAEAVLEKFAHKNINIEYITESSGKEKCCVIFSFCVIHNQLEKARAIVEQLLEDKIIERIQVKEGVSFIGVYGPHFREKPRIAYKMCRALSSAKVNIMSISTSISTFACIIDQSDYKRASEALLREFDLPEND